MVYVPSAEAYGFSLRLEEPAMRELLNGSEIRAVVAGTAESMRGEIVTHVEATASAEDASNYVAALFHEDAFSDDYGFDFSGPYSLGNRPIAIVGIPSGRGPNPAAKPPMLTEADHHALTASRGIAVGMVEEDIR